MGKEIFQLTEQINWISLLLQLKTVSLSQKICLSIYLNKDLTDSTE